MDDLKQYKQVWKDQEYENNKVDKSILSTMIHNKSSSIVKWIFYISIIEFTVWILIGLFPNTDWEQIKAFEMYNFVLAMNSISYIVIVFFIYLFYKNYKSIQVTDTSSALMRSIIKTRQSVKYYIIANIVILVVGITSGAYLSFKTPELEGLIENMGENGSVIVWSITFGIILLSAGVLYLVYQLLYGILLKRLNDNYKELTS